MQKETSVTDNKADACEKYENKALTGGIAIILGVLALFVMNKKDFQCARPRQPSFGHHQSTVPSIQQATTTAVYANNQ